MAIKIKNLENGRTIIIKNQTDMFDLVNHTKEPNYEPLQDDPEQPADDEGQSYPNWQSALRSRNNGYNFDDKSNLNSIDAKDEDDYIKMFSEPEDESQAADTANDNPFASSGNVDTDMPSQSPEQAFSLDSQTPDQDETNTDPNSASGDNFGLENPDDMEQDDKDFAGLIRTVRGACLVYKRANEEGSFDELWIYNIGDNLRKETAIRRSIISGTDINPETQTSDDGDQRASTYTIGNVQFLQLHNIPQ